MVWSSLVSDGAASAMIRLANDERSRRLRYSTAVALVVALAGLTLLLAPAAAPGLLGMLTLLVLAVSLGLGFGPALVTLALGALVAPLSLGRAGAIDTIDVAGLVLYGAEGAGIALIGAVVRAAIRTAHLNGSDSAQEVPTPTRRQRSTRVGPLRTERLTAREVEVLCAAAGGQSVDELASELYVSPNTVKTHLAHCYDKLGAHNRAEAVALAVRAGSLDAEDLDRAAERLGDGWRLN